MARLYTNENFPLPVVEQLRELGHDTLTSYESGNAGQAIPDEDVLAFAVAEKRILFTLNRKHFIRLHHEKPEHFGIMVCTFDPNFAALGDRINQAIEIEAEVQGKLNRINRPP